MTKAIQNIHWISNIPKKMDRGPAEFVLFEPCNGPPSWRWLECRKSRAKRWRCCTFDMLYIMFTVHVESRNTVFRSGCSDQMLTSTIWYSVKVISKLTWSTCDALWAGLERPKALGRIPVARFQFGHGSVDRYLTLPALRASARKQAAVTGCCAEVFRSVLNPF